MSYGTKISAYEIEELLKVLQSNEIYELDFYSIKLTAIFFSKLQQSDRLFQFEEVMEEFKVENRLK